MLYYAMLCYAMGRLRNGGFSCFVNESSFFEGIEREVEGCMVFAIYERIFN